MKTAKTVSISGLLALLVAIFFGALPVFGQTTVVLFEDDFNRANSNVLGTTSVGGYDWIETSPSTGLNPSATASIIEDGKLVFSSIANDPGYAKVDFNLDSYMNYTVSFDLELIGSTNFTTIQPNGSGTHTTLGWRLYQNANGTVDLYYFNPNLSPQTALLASNIFSTNEVVNISIVVTKTEGVNPTNTASLYVNNGSEAVATSVFRNADGAADYFAIYDAGGAGARIDNLVVTTTIIPEPSTITALLAIGALAFASISTLRKRKS
ncbi:PEP-CTERM domain protein [Geminisphaera colitermitum]|uniref:PEP-CTERM domain protein n=1 Tax=Geminisphaera colitermitum TaxID=1148786 RepID=UPI000158CAEA|nr:PEP-CTERM domain protein [Geminisphaera colitermitum]